MKHQQVFTTDFTAKNGCDYVGPQILADCSDEAVAILSVLRGPNGEPLNLVGPEIVTLFEDLTDRES